MRNTEQLLSSRAWHGIPQSKSSEKNSSQIIGAATARHLSTLRFPECRSIVAQDEEGYSWESPHFISSHLAYSFQLFPWPIPPWDPNLTYPQLCISLLLRMNEALRIGCGTHKKKIMDGIFIGECNLKVGSLSFWARGKTREEEFRERSKNFCMHESCRRKSLEKWRE